METNQQNIASLKIIDNVIVITLNTPKSKVNIVNNKVLNEFKKIWEDLVMYPQVEAVILISEKSNCFIAGADVDLLKSFTTADEATAASKSSQQFLKMIENNKIPVIAAIQGVCLGAGLEIALACHYRIAVKNKQTCFGLPEVMLGLLPGAGGTQRLPQVTSLLNAVDMILTGRTITAGKAKEYGIIDMLVDPLPGLDVPEKQMRRYLERTAVDVAKKLVNKQVKMDRHKTGLFNWFLEYGLQYKWVQDQFFNRAKGQVMSKSLGLYPAPLKILDVIRTTLDEGYEAGYEAEAKAFGELAMTSVSKNLLSLFRAQTVCKKNKFGMPQRSVEKIGVVGAGFMGAGIAYVSLNKGYNVILKDVNETMLHKGIKQIQNSYDDAVKKKRLDSFEKDMQLSKLCSTLTYDSFHNADMVIEAVFEDINIKQTVITELEAVTPSTCIIATNTSAISISKIAVKSSRPDKIIGMHYFSPVDKMKLLEVVKTEKTSADTMAAAVSVGLKQGKAVITVNDGPGFYTTRVLTTMVFESLRLLQEGVDPKTLDKLFKGFGFPVGIATLIDEIGLDVIADINKSLTEAFGERFSGGDQNIISDLVHLNFLGRKSGSGIFVYEKKSKKHKVNPIFTEIIKKYVLTPKGAFDDEDKVLRIVSRFVNEAVLCLEENILSNAVEGNVGAVFGLGFPPFTGGPFRWVDAYGASNLVTKMETYRKLYGAPFKPGQTLIDMARDSSKKFCP